MFLENVCEFGQNFFLRIKMICNETFWEEKSSRKIEREINISPTRSFLSFFLFLSSFCSLFPFLSLSLSLSLSHFPSLAGRLV